MSDSELPAGWRLTPLAHLADLALGKMLDKTKHATGLRRPYLRNVNVQWDRIDTGDLNEMFFEEGEAERFGVRAGDLLVCEGGEPGRCAVWDGRAADMRYQKALHRVRPGAQLDARFLMYHLRADALRGALEDYFTGTTIKHFTGTALARYAIRHPSLEDQRRIVAHLDACFARTRHAKAALDDVPVLVDRFRQSILAAAFRGDLTADWREANPDVEPASELLKRIRVERRRRWEEAELAKMVAKGKPPKDDRWKAKYEEPEPVNEEGLPELPAGWAWCSLRAVAQLKGGITKGQKRTAGASVREVPYLRVANVQRGYVDTRDVAVIEATDAEIQELKLEPGDILFNEGGDRDKLGRGWVWSGELPLIIHQNHVFRGRLTSADVQPKLISWYANSAGQEYFLREASQTTNLASINITKLGALPIPMPPAAEQAALGHRKHERPSPTQDGLT